jgi:DNA-directed RNA polymerase subunit M/transcription elongation factor TFIIS
MPTFQKKIVSSQMERLFDFLSRFLDQEFHLSMRVFLPKPIFNEVGKILREWKEVVDDARAKAQARGKIVNDPCPECGASKVLTLGGRDGYVFCHLCESQIPLSFCKKCQRFIVGSLSELSNGRDVCDKCMDEEIDAWIEGQGDASDGR